MTEATARVAVVIPFLGRTAELRECLASVRDQTFADWQAVAVDDGSRDDSGAALVKEFNDPRIRLVRHPVNRGLAAARNTGVRATTAPWILPLDGDDILPTGALDRLLAAVSESPGMDCAFGDIELFGSETGTWRYGVGTTADLARRQWLPGAGALLHRRVWQRAQGWCEDDDLRAGNEDWDFWLAAAAEGPIRAVHVPEVTYRYRRSAGSMSTGSLRLADWRTRMAMVRRHRELFDRHGGAAAFIRAGLWRSAAACLRDGRPAAACGLAARAVAGTVWPASCVPARHNPL